MSQSAPLPLCIRQRELLAQLKAKEPNFLTSLPQFDDQFTGSEALFRTAKSCDFETVKALLERGARRENLFVRMQNEYLSSSNAVLFFTNFLPLALPDEIPPLITIYIRKSRDEDDKSSILDLLAQGYRPTYQLVTKYFNPVYLTKLIEIDRDWVQAAFEAHPETRLESVNQVIELLNGDIRFNYSSQLFSVAHGSGYTDEIVDRLIRKIGDLEVLDAYFVEFSRFNDVRLLGILAATGYQPGLSAAQLLYRAGSSLTTIKRSLELGADPNKSPCPLGGFDRIGAGWFEMAEILFQNGLTVEHFVASIRPLFATEVGSLGELVRFLINKWIPLGFNQSALLFCALKSTSCVDLTRQLLEGGCKVSDRDYTIFYLLKNVPDMSIRNLLWGRLSHEELDRGIPLLNVDMGLPEGPTFLTQVASNVADFPNRSYEDDYISLVGTDRIDYIHAVFDGHGGVLRRKLVECRGKQFEGERDYLNKRHIVYGAIYGGDELLPLHRYIEMNIERLADPRIGVEEAIIDAFIEFDQIAAYRDYRQGACVTMVISVVGQVYVVNLGDSRTIVVADKEIKFASRDHEPGDLIEKARVVAAGGMVTNGDSYSPARIDGALAVARAIGDLTYKGCGASRYDPRNGKVSTVAEVTRMDFERVAGVSYRVILTSDAPYTMGTEFTSEDIVEMLDYCGWDPVKAAELIAPYTCDDLTVMVVEI